MFHRENGTAQIALRELTLGRYWACLIALGIGETRGDGDTVLFVEAVLRGEDRAPFDFDQVEDSRIALFLDEILVEPVDFTTVEVARHTARVAWASVIQQVNTAGMLANERGDLVMDEIAHEPSEGGFCSQDKLMAAFEPHHLVALLDMSLVQAMAWMRCRAATQSLKKITDAYKGRMN